MSEIRKLPAQDERVETGAVQFGDDWPGVFIRGDNAANYALHLRSFIAGPNQSSAPGLNKMIVTSLLKLLEGCRV